MAETLKPYLTGRFIETSRPHDVHNPHTGELVARTWLCDEQVIEEAIRKGLEAKKAMKELPSWKKYEILLFISDSVKKDRERLATVLAKESAKPLRYALAEIDRAAQTFLVAAEESKRIGGEVILLDWTPKGKGKEGIVRHFPVGLVAGISPFNFPMNLAVHKLAPAIASGCPIILKPASSTPLSTLELAKIIDQTDLPKGAVSILPADRTAGNLLVTDDRINLLSFTGSDTVGWKMKAQAGRKKTVLELGGNAGVIVSRSASLEKVMDQAMAGAFAYSGQICIHAQRFFVYKSHYENFLEQMKARAEKLKAGKPEDAETEISSMIDQDNSDRVESWVNEALEQGARMITGGQKQGAFYAPTILTHTRPDMKVNADELFGPVITVEPFDDFSDAVSRLNNSRFGLQCGVYTGEISEMDYAFGEIEAGGIILNEMPTLRFDHMPYGGVKDSGIGREGVRYAMNDMMEPRILVK